MRYRLLLLALLALTAGTADAAVIWKISGRIYDQFATSPDDQRSVDYAAPMDVYLTFDPLAVDSNPDPTRGGYAGLTQVRLTVRGQLAPRSFFDRSYGPAPTASWLTVYNDFLVSGQYVDGITLSTSDPFLVAGVSANTFSLSLLARSPAAGGGPLSSDQLPVGLDRSTFPADPSLFPYDPYIPGQWCAGTLSCPNGGRITLSGYNSINEPYYYGAVVDSITVVPAPAAAWFFGSALLGLAGLRRRVPIRAG